MESYFNGYEVDIQNPLDLMNFEVDEITVTMPNECFVYLFADSKTNVGHYYNEIYGFAVMYFADTELSEVESFNQNGSVNVKMTIYRVKALGNAVKVKPNKHQIKYFEFITSNKKYWFENGRTIRSVDVDGSDSWKFEPHVLSGQWLFTGDEMRLINNV